MALKRLKAVRLGYCIKSSITETYQPVLLASGDKAKHWLFYATTLHEFF